MNERLDVMAGEVRLACFLSGPPDAPPMVLLHALGERSESWDAVRAEFDRHYRVITIDLRGHGDSDWPGEYSYELMRDDVLAALDRLGLDRITLVGHSLGGIVAYLIAQDHPDRVDRLVVEDVPLPYRRERPVPERPDWPVPFDWPVVPAMITQSGEPNPDWWDRLSKITAPTLLVAGGADSHVPREQLDAVAARVPRCTLLTIPVGHHVHDAAPAEFAAAVLSFLRTGD